MSELTVIIPVYNAAAHLADALESVRAQTFKDWECICVDDGSTDASAEILSRFAADDTRFRVVSQANAGPRAARNRGLELARAPWFLFMDSDDVFHPDAFRTLLDAAGRTGADVVTAGYSCDLDKLSCEGTTRVYDDPVARMRDDKSWRGEPWARLMRTEMFADLRFVLRYHEDVGWLTAAMTRSRREAVLDAPIYYYRPMANSFSRRPDYDAALPELWRYQAEVCPALKPRLGEIAYARWKRHPEELTAADVYRLRDDGVISFGRLSISKRIRLLVTFIFNRGARYETYRYDHILSLGYNCEVSFHIYRMFGFVESNPFAWVNARSTENMIRALEDIDGIGKDGWTLAGVMWRDNRTNMLFHGKAPAETWLSGRFTQSDIDADRAELESRMSYLKKKFINMATGAGKLLFVFKYPPDESPTPDHIMAILNALKKICARPFELLMIFEEKMLRGVDLSVLPGNVHVETLLHYAPYRQATSIELSDAAGWKRIWDKYRPRKACRKKRKKKFKFED